MTNNYFLHMIQTLREGEEIILYGNMLNFGLHESDTVAGFLKKQYINEALDFPFVAPCYDEEAGLWGAKTIYTAAQLILYRQHNAGDLQSVMPFYNKEPSPSSILSCDLCLRFLPDMLERLKFIDCEDPLIVILENVLSTWHYSGINYQLKTGNLNFDALSDSCLSQLYINRVIEFKNRELANHPTCKKSVLANLGMFAEEFWNNFSNSHQPHE